MLIKDQADISLQRGLPVEVMADSQHVVAVTEPVSISFYYYNSGTYTVDAGQAAGVKVVAKLTQGGILNSIGDITGTKNDTSLAFTSTAFTTEVACNPQIFEKWDSSSGTTRLTGILADAGVTTNGSYVVDYRTGTLFGIKASTQTSLSSITYKVAMQTSGASSAAAAATAAVNLTQIAGTSVLLDDAAFGIGTTPVIPAGYLADETATDSVTEGDVGAARITLDRKQITASEYAEDTVFASASYVSLIGVEIDDPTALATMTEGDVGNLKASLSGELVVYNTRLGGGESLTEGSIGVQATVVQPLSTSTFAGSKDVSAALEASKIVKATTGNLKRTFGVIDAGAATDIYYILHLDSATLTGDGAVTHLITPIPVNHVNGVDSTFTTPDFGWQLNAVNGIVRVVSTTMVTKTIAGAIMFATTEFK